MIRPSNAHPEWPFRDCRQGLNQMLRSHIGAESYQPGWGTIPLAKLRALTAMVICVISLALLSRSTVVGATQGDGSPAPPQGAQGTEGRPNNPLRPGSNSENQKEYMRLALATLDDKERAALEKLKTVGFWVLQRQGIKFNTVGGQLVLDPPSGIDLCGPPNRYAPPANHPIPTQKDLRALADLRHVETLSLTGEFITDETLELLENMEILSELSLFRTRISDKGLKVLGKLKGVRLVRISSANLTPVGMAALAGMPSVEYVFLTNLEVTDVGVAALVKNKKLKGLAVTDDANGDSKLTDASLRALAGLPHLENLGLPWSKITDQGVVNVIKAGNFPKLWGLSLAHTSVSDTILKALHDPAALPALKQLDVRRTKVTPQGVEALLKARPNLDVLTLFPSPAPPDLKRPRGIAPGLARA